MNALSRNPLIRFGRWLATPAIPESYLELIDPLLGAGPRGRIEQVIRESSNAVSLVISPNDAWQGALAGQYVRLGVDIEGVRHWRCYSVSSGDARRGQRFSVTVRALDGGHVSRWINERARPGMVLMLDQAAGEFTLPQDGQSQGGLPKLLFITAGSGITPAMGMMRSLASANREADLVHLHYTPDDASNLFAEERLGLALAHGWNSQNLFTRAAAKSGAIQGHFSAKRLEALCPDWRERTAYVCGPEALMDSVSAHWQQAELGDQLRQENFRPALKRDANARGGEVRFWNSERAAEASGDKPLLEVAEQAGLLPKHGCRMGICQGCLVTLKEGQVRDLTTGEVFGETGDMVRICVCAAAGNVTLEL
ncbi:MAG: stearoyl-CoA 9-desaturase [Gammaproteobacteria bacterium HGW-Gammaproteobacteria-14]|nr:MAG: stearoyl-CoA 9-desaturase [Gammaproteobacteria bacterium HGW-Gammaproteobacteria-14]